MQITMNNIPVGRSVLEALRLVEAFKAVSDKGVLCPAGWRGEQDDMQSTSFRDRDYEIARELGEMKIKNLDDNTLRSFSLVLPPIKTKLPPIQVSEASINTVSPHHSTTSPTKQNSASHSQNGNIITLEFADMLDAHNGSPRDYVEVKEKRPVEEGQSPSGMQRTVDALKRISSGWATPAASPLSHPSLPKKNSTTSLRSGYFD